MAKPFDDILLKGIRRGQIPARTNAARHWYRNVAKDYTNVSETSVMSDKSRMTSKPYVGSMYMFQYDAKHKTTLPYWDRLPLIFPFEMVKGGFLGINLHYLPLSVRAMLMDGLYELKTDDRYDHVTRLNLNYKVLKSASRLRWGKPCVKRYLTSHVRSRFLHVSSTEWDIALFLPLERFQKASKQEVWSDSTRKLAWG